MDAFIEHHISLGLYFYHTLISSNINSLEFSIQLESLDVDWNEVNNPYRADLFLELSGSPLSPYKFISVNRFEPSAYEHEIVFTFIEEKNLTIKESKFNFVDLTEDFKKKNPWINKQEFLIYLFNYLNKNDDEIAFSRFNKNSFKNDLLEFWGKNVSTYLLKEKLQKELLGQQNSEKLVKI